MERKTIEKIEETNNKIKKELYKNTLSQFPLIYKYKFMEDLETLSQTL